MNESRPVLPANALVALTVPLLGVPSADPAPQEQTNAATRCWAAANCDGYDPIGDDFTYETPDGY